MAKYTTGNRTYDDADVTIAMLGDLPSGITEISYSKETDHEPVYVLGRRDPIHYSLGNNSYTASMTMLLSDVSRLEDAVGGDKDLVSIEPFWVFITYTNENYKVIVDKMRVKFKSQGREVSDTAGMAQQFELFVMEINFNTV